MDAKSKEITFLSWEHSKHWTVPHRKLTHFALNIIGAKTLLSTTLYLTGVDANQNLKVTRQNMCIFCNECYPNIVIILFSTKTWATTKPESWEHRELTFLGLAGILCHRIEESDSSRSNAPFSRVFFCFQNRPAQSFNRLLWLVRSRGKLHF